jgi:hypothetical protein
MMGKLLSRIRDSKMARVKQREAVAGKGIGEPLITEFLADVPGVSKATVWQPALTELAIAFVEACEAVIAASPSNREQSARQPVRRTPELEASCRIAMRR